MKPIELLRFKTLAGVIMLAVALSLHPGGFESYEQYEARMKSLEEAARHGDAQAAYWRAENHINPCSTAFGTSEINPKQPLSKTNFPLALHWYLIAADLGHALSQYIIGQAYLAGSLQLGWDNPEIQAVTLPKNPKLASDYLRKSAEQGLWEAAFALGKLCDTGLCNGTEKPDSLYWYELAGTSGSMDAQIRVAEIHLNRGEPDQAHLWYSLCDWNLMLALESRMKAEDIFIAYGLYNRWIATHGHPKCQLYSEHFYISGVCVT